MNVENENEAKNFRETDWRKEIRIKENQIKKCFVWQSLFDTVLCKTLVNATKWRR